MQRILTKPFLVWGAVVVVATVAVGGYVVSRKPKTQYQFITAGSRFLSAEARASGKIITAQDVDLSFDRTGRIGRVAVAAGIAVHKGDVLVALDNGIEAGQLAQAQAALNLRLVGATDAEISVAHAVADAAKADLDKTKVDTDNAVAAAQAALDIAENNLKLANGGENSQIVGQAYENEIATLQSALPKIDDALTQANNILDFGNPSGAPGGNQYVKHLGLLDPTTVSRANTLYQTVSNVRVSVSAQVNNLTSGSHETVDTAAGAVLSELTNELQLLGAVSDALRATLPEDTQTQSMLDAKKTIIEGTRNGLSLTNNAVVAVTQAVTNAKNSLTTYTIARDKAERDLTAVTADAISSVATKQAVYEQALANVAIKTEPPREVDVAALRAVVAAAAANFNKTILVSPFDGTISSIDAKVGASAVPGMVLVSVINESNYQLEVRLSEATVGNIHVGDSAVITVDAYGSQMQLPATVVAVDSAVSTADGETGYKVTLQFNQPDSRLKVDMTGNATITAATTTAAVAVPASSLIQKNGQYVVLVDAGNGVTREQAVTVGLKSADNWVEITSGLSAGSKVVVF